jgi:hypothetical protein
MMEASMKDPLKRYVDVYLDSVEDPKNPKFRIEPQGNHKLPKGPDGLIFENDGHPGFHIHFTLIDNTGQGYLWPSNKDKDDAVWSKVGTAVNCPGSPDREVFHATAVDGTRTTLHVNNPNPEPKQGPFKYTLCVTNDDGKTYLALDPGGVNNNGSYTTTKPPGAFALSPSTVVALVALVAIAAFAMYEFGVFAH